MEGNKEIDILKWKGHQEMEGGEEGVAERDASVIKKCYGCVPTPHRE